MNNISKKAWKLVTLLALDLALLILITSVCAINSQGFYLGYNGENIAEIQQVLKEKSLYSGEISGEYNIETRSAVKNFQKKLFGKGNGQADYKTLSALGINSRSSPCFSAKAEMLALLITLSDCKNYPQMLEKGIEILRKNNIPVLGKVLSLNLADVKALNTEISSQAYSAAVSAILISDNL